MTLSEATNTRINWITQNSKGDIEERGTQHLFSTQETIEEFMNSDCEGFYDYGLSFEPEECEKTGAVAYWRFIMSWGGPSDELRFYPNGAIEYVFLDWFCGIGFNVTGEEWAEWVFSQFDEMEMIKWNIDL